MTGVPSLVWLAVQALPSAVRQHMCQQSFHVQRLVKDLPGVSIELKSNTTLDKLQVAALGSYPRNISDLVAQHAFIVQRVQALIIGSSACKLINDVSDLDSMVQKVGAMRIFDLVCISARIDTGSFSFKMEGCHVSEMSLLSAMVYDETEKAAAKTSTSALHGKHFKIIIGTEEYDIYKLHHLSNAARNYLYRQASQRVVGYVSTIGTESVTTCGQVCSDIMTRAALPTHVNRGDSQIRIIHTACNYFQCSLGCLELILPVFLAVASTSTGFMRKRLHIELIDEVSKSFVSGTRFMGHITIAP